MFSQKKNNIFSKMKKKTDDSGSEHDEHFGYNTKVITSDHGPIVHEGDEYLKPRIAESKGYLSLYVFFCFTLFLFKLLCSVGLFAFVCVCVCVCVCVFIFVCLLKQKKRKSMPVFLLCLKRHTAFKLSLCF